MGQAKLKISEYLDNEEPWEQVYDYHILTVPGNLTGYDPVFYGVSIYLRPYEEDSVEFQVDLGNGLDLNINEWVVIDTSTRLIEELESQIFELENFLVNQLTAVRKNFNKAIDTSTQPQHNVVIATHTQE